MCVMLERQTSCVVCLLVINYRNILSYRQQWSDVVVSVRLKIEVIYLSTNNSSWITLLLVLFFFFLKCISSNSYFILCLVWKSKALPFVKWLEKNWKTLIKKNKKIVCNNIICFDVWIDEKCSNSVKISDKLKVMGAPVTSVSMRWRLNSKFHFVFENRF